MTGSILSQWMARAVAALALCGLVACADLTRPQVDVAPARPWAQVTAMPVVAPASAGASAAGSSAELGEEEDGVFVDLYGGWRGAREEEEEKAMGAVAGGFEDTSGLRKSRGGDGVGDGVGGSAALGVPEAFAEGA